MSSDRCALLSATFWEAGYDHLVELVHQRDVRAHRHLDSLDVAVHDAQGALLGLRPVDPRYETLDLSELVEKIAGPVGRAMVTFEARYDEKVFPYRPHHYAFLHRRGSDAPPLYYAVNAVLGGVPDRIGATTLNNYETYVFRERPFAARYSVLLGNLARFAAAEAQVAAYYGGERVVREVTLAPKAHLEVEVPPEREGRRLARVEVKALFRLASYVVARRAASGELVLFDHLFTYIK
jgi:hypothetical protein